MAQAVAGQPLNLIGRAVQKMAKQKGFKVIKNLGGHGVGRELHEEPRFIAGYYKPDRSPSAVGRPRHHHRAVPLEPHGLRAGDGQRLDAERPQGSWAAQYEHTVIITRGQPIPVTAV